MLDTAARNVETLTEKIAECVLVAFPTSRCSSSILTPNITTTRIKEKDASKLEDEYRRLVEGLQQSEENVEDEDFMANPSEWRYDRRLDSTLLTNGTPAALPQDLLQEAVPGNIRRAEHFTAFLARFVEYLKVSSYHSALEMAIALTTKHAPTAQTRMRVLHVVAETPLSFLQHLRDITFIERKPLK